mmetsp:Transcript_85308/g.178263  ORF Transcript_85308/g.178263 Transcript_85308/m.178263 type:complete len:86 (+) Transcript_85308:563-820(+)
MVVRLLHKAARRDSSMANPWFQMLCSQQQRACSQFVLLTPTKTDLLSFEKDLIPEVESSIQSVVSCLLPSPPPAQRVVTAAFRCL